MMNSIVENIFGGIMMQDKNDINAMAKRYKEEMMLAYSKKRIGGTPPGTAPKAPKQEAEKEKKEQHIPIPAPAPKIKQIENEAVHRSHQEEKKPEKDLDHPPMPEIPKMEAASSQEKDTSCPPAPEMSKPDCTDENTTEKWKFLTAEELIKRDSEAAAETCTDTDAGTSASEDTEDTEHHQGNYDFPAVPDKEYEKEVEDFISGDGAGYIQVEVTCEENSCPIEGAAVAVTRQAGDDMDTLAATLVTGADGCTEAVTLPAGEGKYMVTVYKEGFFTVRDLEVPVFDTIKSIQPVTMTEIGNKV